MNHFKGDEESMSRMTKKYLSQLLVNTCLLGLTEVALESIFYAATAMRNKSLFISQ